MKYFTFSIKYYIINLQVKERYYEKLKIPYGNNWKRRELVEKIVLI